MKGVIDRFEGKMAVVVLDDGECFNIEISKLPGEARPGDVIIIEENITIDYNETKNRKEKANKYLELWED